MEKSDFLLRKGLVVSSISLAVHKDRLQWGQERQSEAGRTDGAGAGAVGVGTEKAERMEGWNRILLDTRTPCG